MDLEFVTKSGDFTQPTVTTAVVAGHVSLGSPVEVVADVGVVQDLNIPLHPRYDSLP